MMNLKSANNPVPMNSTPLPAPLSPGGGTRPENHLVAAILSTCFCCMPLGIVAIIYACQVDSLYQQGRTEEARKASNDAAFWCNLSLILGLVFIALPAITGAIIGLFGSLQ